MQVLPGEGKNSHMFKNCLHEILDCIVRPDTTALLYKVLLSLLFSSVWKQSSEEETWKTSCSEKKKLECKDSAGGRKIPGGVGCSLRSVKKKKSPPVSLKVSHRKREYKHVENNLLTYHPLRQTSVTTPWLTQKSSLSAGQAIILTELPMSFCVETSAVPQTAGTAGDQGALAPRFTFTQPSLLLHCLVQWLTHINYVNLRK